MAGSRHHPPQHGSFVVAVDQDREFAFLVGLDALIGLATLLEAAKDMLSRITRRHDGLAGWPDSSIIRRRSMFAGARARSRMSRPK
jgi:hypothetical protein